MQQGDTGDSAITMARFRPSKALERELKGTNKTGFCKILRFPAVFCENLLFPAVFCKNPRLQNAVISRKSEISKICKICDLSLLVHLDHPPKLAIKFPKHMTKKGSYGTNIPCPPAQYKGLSQRMWSTNPNFMACEP